MDNELLCLLRQFRHNNSDEFVSGFDRDGVIALVSGLRAELEASETELRIARTSQAESNAEVERLRAELAECKRLLRRYRTETVLGHQPHMIAHEVDAALAEEGEK